MNYAKTQKNVIINNDFGVNFVIDELNQIEDNEKYEKSEKKENNSINKITEPKPEVDDSINKSNKLSQSESNLEKFKMRENSSRKNSKKNSITSRRNIISKNNSISHASKNSRNVTEDRYKAEPEAEENDILDQFERSENSKKNENSNLRMSEKGQSRVESLKNEEENNGRFVVTKEEPEPEPQLEPEKNEEEY